MRLASLGAAKSAAGGADDNQPDFTKMEVSERSEEKRSECVF